MNQLGQDSPWPATPSRVQMTDLTGEGPSGRPAPSLSAEPQRRHGNEHLLPANPPHVSADADRTRTSRTLGPSPDPGPSCARARGPGGGCRPISSLLLAPPRAACGPAPALPAGRKATRTEMAAEDDGLRASEDTLPRNEFNAHCHRSPKQSLVPRPEIPERFFSPAPRVLKAAEASQTLGGLGLHLVHASSAHCGRSRGPVRPAALP